ncbi:MAG TPA: hypothetical protein VLD61_07065 [Methylomirabilota bacterium]|nr:hypothetical protein [Methylomirabilota bacterium]
MPFGITETKPVPIKFMGAPIVFDVTSGAVLTWANSIPNGASGVLVSLKGADVHWAVNTDPSSAAGNLLPKAQRAAVLIQNDPETVRQLRFIAIEAGTGKLIANFFQEP